MLMFLIEIYKMPIFCINNMKVHVSVRWLLLRIQAETFENDEIAFLYTITYISIKLACRKVYELLILKS